MGTSGSSNPHNRSSMGVFPTIFILQQANHGWLGIQSLPGLPDGCDRQKAKTVSIEATQLLLRCLITILFSLF